MRRTRSYFPDGGALGLHRPLVRGIFVCLGDFSRRKILNDFPQVVPCEVHPQLSVFQTQPPDFFQTLTLR